MSAAVSDQLERDAAPHPVGIHEESSSSAASPFGAVVANPTTRPLLYRHPRALLVHADRIEFEHLRIGEHVRPIAVVGE